MADDGKEEKSEGVVAAAAAAPAPAAAPHFEIKKWSAVAMWSWDICADTCAICRNGLNEPSIEYQVYTYVGTFLILIVHSKAGIIIVFYPTPSGEPVTQQRKRA
jgi:hypothetical protein